VKAHRFVRCQGSHIFSRQLAHSRLSALRAGHPLSPGRFLVLISVRGWVDPRALMQLERLVKLEKIHLIGTQTHDHLASSIVPQPTTLQVAVSNKNIRLWIKNLHTSRCPCIMRKKCHYSLWTDQKYDWYWWWNFIAHPTYQHFFVRY
jgi:hypothetical protein